jgi:hypothetical protein
MKRKLNLYMDRETLPTISDVRILKVIKEHPEGINQYTIQRLTGLSKGQVSKRLKRMVNSGYLFYKTGFRNRCYFLDEPQREDVQMLIYGFEKGNKVDIFDVHAAGYKFEVHNLSKKEQNILTKKELFKQFNPKRYVGYSESYNGLDIMFRKTKKSTFMWVYLSVFTPKLEIADYLLQQKLKKIIEIIKRKYPGIILEKREQTFTVSKKEVAWILHPFAQLGMLLGFKNKWKEIEASWDVPEWEEKGLDSIEKMNEMYKMWKNAYKKRQGKHSKD